MRPGDALYDSNQCSTLSFDFSVTGDKGTLTLLANFWLTAQCDYCPCKKNENVINHTETVASRPTKRVFMTRSVIFPIVKTCALCSFILSEVVVLLSVAFKQYKCDFFERPFVYSSITHLNDKLIKIATCRMSVQCKLHMAPENFHQLNLIPEIVVLRPSREHLPVLASPLSRLTYPWWRCVRMASTSTRGNPASM